MVKLASLIKPFYKSGLALSLPPRNKCLIDCATPFTLSTTLATLPPTPSTLSHLGGVKGQRTCAMRVLVFNNARALAPHPHFEHQPNSSVMPSYLVLRNGHAVHSAIRLSISPCAASPCVALYASARAYEVNLFPLAVTCTVATFSPSNCRTLQNLRHKLSTGLKYCSIAQQFPKSEHLLK